MNELTDSVSSLLEHKWLAFLVGSALSPALLKILEYLLARPASRQTQAQQLIDSYLKETERLTAENTRLYERLHRRDLEFDELWEIKEKLRQEMHALRDQAQTLILRNTLLEENMKRMKKGEPDE